MRQGFAVKMQATVEEQNRQTSRVDVTFYFFWIDFNVLLPVQSRRKLNGRIPHLSRDLSLEETLLTM